MNYSVVIPAYNTAATIAETIESALQQSVPPAEIIVIDDGSTDGTREIVSRFGDRVAVYWQANQGPGVAMSHGMRRSRFPVISSIDSDDLWLPKKMETQLEFLYNNEACGGVFAQVQLFGNSVSEPVVQDGWNRSTMVIRRQVFDSIGDLIDPPGRRGEMIDWIARARESGFIFEMLPTVLARRRVHPGSLSYQRDSARDCGYVHVARAAMLRKRARAEGAKS